jgi:siroheme synthase (precorrin-2 oxidase/ferrochelatase)
MIPRLYRSAMMVNELRQAIEEALQQPEEMQRGLAQRIREWLEEAREERERDAIVGSPHGQETLAKLVAEAHEERAR